MWFVFDKTIFVLSSCFFSCYLSSCYFLDALLIFPAFFQELELGGVAYNSLTFFSLFFFFFGRKILFMLFQCSENSLFFFFKVGLFSLRSTQSPLPLCRGWEEPVELRGATGWGAGESWGKL